MKKGLYLFQPQYAVDYGNERNYWIPYSIGCIWSYAQQFQDIQHAIECKDIFFKRDNHDVVMKKIQSPDICAFSCYQWNKNYNLTLAQQIKQKFPNCVIVFGGPEVTTEFLEFSQVDSIILGEGELSFLELLRAAINNYNIPQIFFKTRVDDLTTIPSPYTTGVFDKIIADNPGVKWATTLETNRGCPFSCTFCDWGSLTYSKIKRFDLSRTQQDLDWISSNPVSYIFCADANFGIFKQRDLTIAKMVRAAADRSEHLEAFNATFNKNNNEWSFEILRELGDLNRGFTVSVQSMNPQTLTAIRRDNLGINDLENIFQLCQQNNINSYTELILGLPCETKQSFISGLYTLLELGQHNHVEIWFADLLVNSELASKASMEKYKIKTVTTGNYLTLNLENDKLREDIEVVAGTETMSREDMIESFMHGWIIVNLHMQGYTQFTSRYYNKKQNIKFETFYNKLIENFQQNPDLARIYTEVKNIITTFLTTGTLPPKLSGHNLVFCNSYDLYINRQQIFAVLDQTVKQLTNQVVNDVTVLQSLAIFDADIEYPTTISLNSDIFDNRATSCTVSNKMSSKLTDNFANFYYVMRRKGALKNTFTPCYD